MRLTRLVVSVFMSELFRLVSLSRYFLYIGHLSPSIAISMIRKVRPSTAASYQANRLLVVKRSWVNRSTPSSL